MARVQLKNVEKTFNKNKVLKGINVEVPDGSFMVMVGPSGCGKSTALRCIAGLEEVTGGSIFIGDEDVTRKEPKDRNIAMVFQNYALYPHMNVFDNITYGLKVRGIPADERKRRAEDAAKLLGLDGLLDRMPKQLSGGQRQRVAFARALAPNPQVLLLDEPFAAIDAKVRQELRNWLKDTIHRVGITSIFVTHDQDEAVEVADEIIITNHGHIEQVGTPLDIYRQPRTPFVAQFIGTPVVINNCNILTGFLQVGAGKQAIVRPEFLKIYKHGTMKQYISAAEEGTVEAVVFRGSHLDVTVRIKGLAIHGEYSFDDPPLSVGETVQVLIYRLYVLDGDKTYLKENSAMTSADVFYI